MPNTFTYRTVFSKKMLKNFDLESKMKALVNTNYEGEIKEAGNTVKATLFGDMPIQNYTPGTDMTVSDLATTDTTMVIDQVKAFNGIIDKVEITQSHLPLVSGWLKRAAVAMAQTVDTRLLGHFADMLPANIIGSDALPIDLTKDNVYDYFVNAGELLIGNGVPMDEVFFVVDEGTRSLLLKSPDYVKSTLTGDMVVRKGELQDVAGFKVVVSPRIQNIAGVKNLLYFHKECISLAMQIPEDYVEMYKPEKRHGTGLKGLALYSSKVFIPKAGGVLKKAA